MLLELLGQCGVGAELRLQHDEGLDQFGAFRIGLADHRRLDHRGVLDQRALHVEGTDPIAAGGDHVIGTADEADAAVVVELDGIAAQVVIANEGLGGHAQVAGKPEQRRAPPIHRQHAGLAGWQLAALFVQHHHAVAGHGIAGGAKAYRMLQPMVIAQHHAQLGLAVVIVDGAAQALGKPADHLRGQRLAGTAHRAQLALEQGLHLVPGGQQQAIGGGRAGQVADAVLADHPAGALDTESSLVEGGGVAHGQRTGHRVVETVGPAWVGQVPERLVLAQVHSIAQITDEGGDGLERHRHRLGQAGGAGGEHHQEGILCAAQHRLEAVGLGFQLSPEIRLAASGVQRQQRRRVDHLVQFGAIGGVHHHQTGAGAGHAMLDGLGAEGGEQRLVDRAQTPSTEDGDQQLGGAR
ncbi:hypothetical protein D3C84_391390 [compost metagenome]